MENRVKAFSETYRVIDIRLDKIDGPLIARADIKKDSDWKIINSQLSEIPFGIHNLVVVLNENSNLEIDWISFE